MRIQTALYGMVLAAGAVLAPLSSEARVVVDIGVAPPPARVEVVPAARAGYIWAPGYWYWNGRAHAWHAGYWVRERHGYRWVGAHWEPAGPRWHYVPGYWAR
jgi:hypothetical protein